MLFNKETFLDDLFHHFKETQHLKTDMDVYRAIAPHVYTVTNGAFTERDLKELPNYSRFLHEWKLYNDRQNGSLHRYSIPMISPMIPGGVKNQYNAWARSGRFPDCPETVISLCRACGVNDFEYIKTAVNTYCSRTFEGKGLRKILLFGVARGFIDIGELEIKPQGNGYQFGLVEQYYEKYLADFNSKDDITTYMDNGTIEADEEEKKCQTRDDFFRLLEKSKIIDGILCDVVELIAAVEDMVECRKQTPNESINNLFLRYNAKSVRPNYSKMLHGERPEPEWFLKFALGLRLTRKEISRIKRLLHATDPYFAVCCDIISETNEAFPKIETNSAYKNRLRLLAATVFSDGITINDKYPDFCTFIQSRLE